MDDDTPPGWVMAVGFVLAGAAGLWLAYATILAFVGGTLWPLGIDFGGSLGFGLVWLFIGDPIAAMLLYWAFMAIVMLLSLVAGVVRAIGRAR